MGIKKDCFGWNGHACRCLNEIYCATEECKFYICQKEYEARKKVLEGNSYVRKISRTVK